MGKRHERGGGTQVDGAVEGDQEAEPDRDRRGAQRKHQHDVEPL
jgi:hypothetical protein